MANKPDHNAERPKTKDELRKAYEKYLNKVAKQRSGS